MAKNRNGLSLGLGRLCIYFFLLKRNNLLEMCIQMQTQIGIVLLKGKGMDWRVVW